MDFSADMELLTKKAAILKALAHPVRLCIARGLAQRGESNVSQMQNCLMIPQSTVSQHLTILKSAGIIKGTRKGTEIFYDLEDDTVREVIKALLAED